MLILQIQIEVSLGNPYVMLFNKTTNVCAYLERKHNDPVVTLLFDELKNIFKLTKCPLAKVY